jgi:hypothetical protein
LASHGINQLLQLREAPGFGNGNQSDSYQSNGRSKHKKKRSREIELYKHVILVFQTTTDSVLKNGSAALHKHGVSRLFIAVADLRRNNITTPEQRVYVSSAFTTTHRPSSHLVEMPV